MDKGTLSRGTGAVVTHKALVLVEFLLQQTPVVIGGIAVRVPRGLGVDLANVQVEALKNKRSTVSATLSYLACMTLTK